MCQLSANLYVHTWPYDQVQTHGCNHGFVVTSEGIVAIDSPYLPTDAVKWRDVIAEKGELCFIINTEHHRDHTTGCYFLPGTVISSQRMRDDFGETLGTPDDVRQRVKDDDPQGIHLVEKYKARPPNITFHEHMNLYMGNHTFELIHLPGHTPGQVGVYIPLEKVIFTGDNFTNGWQPGLLHCHPLEWVESLKKIEALDVEMVVSGHGSIGDKQAVRAFRGFIEECIDVVSKAIKYGMSKEEAADNISFETEAYPPVLHPGAEWQRSAVVNLYEQLSK